MSEYDQNPPSKRWSRIALLGFVASLTAAAVAIVSGLGYRMAWWDFNEGFTLLKQAFFGNFAALAIALLGCVVARPGGKKRGFIVALCGLTISAVVAWVPWNEMQKVRSLPPIHDITTDTENPPAFVAVLPLRGSDANSTDYAGSAIAKLQKDAYPDIKPLFVEQPLDYVYAHALTAAEGMGWEIVAADPAAGRIEATATTFWYGFKDDVVIRLTSVKQGTRVDVRSISRVGGSDVGANAARIRAFFKKIE